MDTYCWIWELWLGYILRTWWILSVLYAIFDLSVSFSKSEEEKVILVLKMGSDRMKEIKVIDLFTTNVSAKTSQATHFFHKVFPSL